MKINKYRLFDLYGKIMELKWFIIIAIGFGSFFYGVIVGSIKQNEIKNRCKASLVKKFTGVEITEEEARYIEIKICPMNRK